MRHFRYQLLILSSVAALSYSCATPQKPVASKSIKKKPTVVTKTGSKTSGADEGPATTETIAAPAAASSINWNIGAERRQSQFIQAQLADESKTVTEEEEKSVLPPAPDAPAQGSLAEAAAVVVVLKKTMSSTLPQKTGPFVEQDTTTPPAPGTPPPQPDKPKSMALIEMLSQQRLIDFVRASEFNPFLQAPAAQRLAVRALERSSDSQTYKDRAFAALRRVSDQWTSHQVSLTRAMGSPVTMSALTSTGPAPITAPPVGGAPTAGNQAATSPPTAIGLTQPATGAGAPPPDLSTTGKPVEVKPVEAGKEDAALQEAQTLADAGKYQEAIAKAHGIGATSPAHAKAQERIKSISNRAVQELRMKAAQAFQGSLPISDPKARTAYLERAKRFLEEAIKSFPQADQLGTVKENLTVITRDIERLKDEAKR